MNINLLKTFLEVARLRHFGKAADRLCLTQAAVSARIKQVEETLGVTLLTRDRNNIQLTAEGRRLAVAAEGIIKQWERAKNEISLASHEEQQLVRIGLIHDIWTILSADWLAHNHVRMPDLMFQLQSYSAPLLQERLLSDEVDAALLFDPPYHPGYEVTDIGSVELRLLSTKKVSLQDSGKLDYLYIDWGASYSGLHHQQLGDILTPGISMNISSMAFDYLQKNDGMAYLPFNHNHQQQRDRCLYEVKGAPRFNRGMFYVYRKAHPLADTLRQLAPVLI